MSVHFLSIWFLFHFLVSSGCAQNQDCGRRGLEQVIRTLNDTETDSTEWPFVARVQKAITDRDGPRFWCSASLIRPNWVLTAAHCLKDDTIDYMVVMGEHFLNEETTTDRQVYRSDPIGEKQIFRFLCNNKQTYDAALIKLNNNSNLPNLSLINMGLVCLPNETTSVAPGTQCDILGWGQTNSTSDAPPTVMTTCKMAILPETECHRFKGQYGDCHQYESLLCTRNEQGFGALFGDSGGPLVCRMEDDRLYVMGVTNSGTLTRDEFQPFYFGKVTAFRKWIRKTIESN